MSLENGVSGEKRLEIIEASRETFPGCEVSGYDARSFVLNPNHFDNTSTEYDHLLVSADKKGGKIRVDTDKNWRAALELSMAYYKRGLGYFGVEPNFKPFND